MVANPDSADKCARRPAFFTEKRDFDSFGTPMTANHSQLANFGEVCTLVFELIGAVIRPRAGCVVYRSDSPMQSH
jgi:hypothetical protein